MVIFLDWTKMVVWSRHTRILWIVVELAGGGSAIRLPLLLAIFVAYCVLLSLELLGDLTILLCVVSFYIRLFCAIFKCCILYIGQTSWWTPPVLLCFFVVFDVQSI